MDEQFEQLMKKFKLLIEARETDLSTSTTSKSEPEHHHRVLICGSTEEDDCLCVDVGINSTRSVYYDIVDHNELVFAHEEEKSCTVHDQRVQALVISQEELGVKDAHKVFGERSMRGISNRKVLISGFNQDEDCLYVETSEYVQKKLLISGFNETEDCLCVETYEDVTKQNFMLSNENEETIEEVFVEFCNSKDHKFENSSTMEHEKFESSLAYITAELGLICDSKIIVKDMLETTIVIIECAKTCIQHAYWSTKITQCMSQEEWKHGRKRLLIFDPGGEEVVMFKNVGGKVYVEAEATTRRPADLLSSFTTIKTVMNNLYDGLAEVLWCLLKNTNTRENVLEYLAEVINKNKSRANIQVGTVVVTRGDGRLAVGRLGALCEQIQELNYQGYEVILVTSGAVGVGRQRLRYRKLVNNSFPELQKPKLSLRGKACAAVGQNGLMAIYDTLFSQLDVTSAQFFVTDNDFRDSDFRKQLTETVKSLLALKVVPIFNENDAVSTRKAPYEDSSGILWDNDSLAALLALELKADLLVLLSDVNGLFSGPPSDPHSKLIHIYIKERLEGVITFGEKSRLGRGGMNAKVKAAVYAAYAGIPVVIISGFAGGNIINVLQGERIGTIFHRDAHKWIPVEHVGVHEMAVAARESSKRLQAISSQERSKILLDIADARSFGEA